MVVSVADGILGADTTVAAAETDFEADESFDMASFLQLRSLIIPWLGGAGVGDGLRKAYGESLFRASIIHPFAGRAGTKAGDVELSSQNGLMVAGRGTTGTIRPGRRRRMSYIAFEELFSLASAATKRQEDNAGSAESVVAMRRRIGVAVEPLLVLRCALVLRALVVDQPLRGQMPQPLSQRKELIWTLGKLVALRSKAETAPAGSRGRGRPGDKADADGHGHGQGGHDLLALFPLLVRAQRVGAEDGKVAELLREALEAVGWELGIA